MRFNCDFILFAAVVVDVDDDDDDATADGSDVDDDDDMFCESLCSIAIN